MGATSITAITYGGTGNFKARADSVHFNKRIKRAVVAASASYATGGDSVALSSLGLKTVDNVLIIASEGGTRSGMMIPSSSYNGKGVSFDVTDPAAPKMKVYTAAATEASAASDQSSVTVVAEFHGQA